MAKPLSKKSKIIRDAITKLAHMGNKEIAEMLTDSQDRLDDKLEFKPTDVAQQRQAMKKAPAAAPVPQPTKAATSDQARTPTAPKGNGRRKPGRKKAAAAPPRAAAPQVAQAAAVELIDKTLDLAAQAGGVAALKRLVDRLAEMRGW